MNNLVLRVSRAGRLPAPGECAATGACAGSRGPGARAAGRAGQELGPGARGRRRGRPSTLPRTPRGRPRAPGDLGRAPQETEHPWSPRRGVTPEHRLGTYCVHSTGRSVQEPAGPPADCPSGQSPGPGSGDHGGSGGGGTGSRRWPGLAPPSGVSGHGFLFAWAWRLHASRAWDLPGALDLQVDGFHQILKQSGYLFP